MRKCWYVDIKRINIIVIIIIIIIIIILSCLL